MSLPVVWLQVTRTQYMTDDADARCICAVNDACRQLNERLAPYKQSMKGATFEEIVRTAHMDRIDLSAHGWYITPDITGEDCSSISLPSMP